MKINCLWLTCGEYNHTGETEGDHMNEDNCWGCAPFWWKIPVCPKCEIIQRWGEIDRIRLNPSGYCKKCKKFYFVKEK